MSSLLRSTDSLDSVSFGDYRDELHSRFGYQHDAPPLLEGSDSVSSIGSLSSVALSSLNSVDAPPLDPSGAKEISPEDLKKLTKIHLIGEGVKWLALAVAFVAIMTIPVGIAVGTIVPPAFALVGVSIVVSLVAIGVFFMADEVKGYISLQVQNKYN